MALINKQTNYHFSYSIVVNNTQQKVWNFLIDVKRWKEWDTELKNTTLLEKFSLQAKGILTPKKGPKLKFYISKLTPNTSYTFVTKMPIGTLEITRTLERKGSQIEFTDAIKFTGILKHIFGFTLGRGFKLILPEVMQNFKELAEQE